MLVTENIAGDAMDALRKQFDVAVEPQLYKSSEKIHALIGDFRALIVRNQTRVDRELIAAARNLQVIGRAGVGLDNVDLTSASDAGVVVVYTPEQNAISVAELTIGLMLGLARAIPAADASNKSGKWERQGFTGTELFGKTLGVVGLGRIGFLVAMRSRALGMRILAHDSYISRDSVMLAECGATLVSLEELLKQSDVLSIHVPKTPQTTNLFNAGRFAQMKGGALLINTSRGEVIDEEALIAALREKKIAGAALDVRSTEPPVAGELEKMPNVILTPHVAAFTVEGQRRVLESVCRDVSAVLNGSPPNHYANFPTPRKSSR